MHLSPSLTTPCAVAELVSMMASMNMATTCMHVHESSASHACIRACIYGEREGGCDGGGGGVLVVVRVWW